MPEFLPRSTWTAVARPTAKLTPLRGPRGFAVHWPGSKGTFARPTLAQSCRRIEAERRLHVTGRGWSDIAYSGAVDLAGRVFDLRGVGWRSAANGDAAQNARYGALTVLAGIDDEITPEAIEGVRWWREHVWLPAHPGAVDVVGHRDLHATECCGPRLYALVRSGAFTRPAAVAARAAADQEDDMPLSDDDLRRIAEVVQSDKARFKVRDGAELVAPVDALSRILAAVRVVTSPEVLAAALAKHLPAGVGVDTAAVADAVAAELAERLRA